MAWQVLQVSTPSITYTLLGGFVVAFSLVSLLVRETLYINEVVLGSTFGILIGPHVGNLFNPRGWGDAAASTVTLEVTRFVLATGLFAIGVELPRTYLRDHARSLIVLVVPTMAIGWVVIAAIIHALFPNLAFTSSLAIAACLTPTDPIICAAIVGGKFAKKHVPLNLRRILSAESAANDGLAYPFLTISLYLTLEKSPTVAVEKWFLIGCLYQVVLGTVLGAVLGTLFSHLMRASQRRGFIDRESYVAQYLALVLLTMGICSTIGTDDLLAAFAAGSAVSWDGHFNDQTEDDLFSVVIDLLLNCACFVYIGAWLPFASFSIPEQGIFPYRLILLFLSVMVLRRIPALLILYRWVPEIVDWKEALFSGHFGPMGVGAVFMSCVAMKQLTLSNGQPGTQRELLTATLQPIVSFIVMGSILFHGLSIPFFSAGRKLRSRTLSLSASGSLSVPPWLSRTHASTINVTGNENEQSKNTGEQVADDGQTTTADITRAEEGCIHTPDTLGPSTTSVEIHQTTDVLNKSESDDSAGPAVPRAVHFPAPQ